MVNFHSLPLDAMLTTGKETVGVHPPVELAAEGQVGAPPWARGWLRASRVAGQGSPTANRTVERRIRY